MNPTKGKLSVKRIGSKLFIVDDKGFTVTKVRFSKKAEVYATELVRRWNAFEEGGLVRIIYLTQGQFTIVDDENHGWLSKYKWCAFWNKYTKSFYAARTARGEDGKRHLIYMAREILGLKYGDKRQADHINHHTLDNRIINLRIVTQQQNQWNQKNPKGYYWDKRREKYRAHIRFNGKDIHLGYFLTTKEAHEAYLQAKPYYHNFRAAIAKAKKE